MSVKLCVHVYRLVRLCLLVSAVASFFRSKCGRQDKNRCKPQWYIRHMSFHSLLIEKHVWVMRLVQHLWLFSKHYYASFYSWNVLLIIKRADYYTGCDEPCYCQMGSRRVGELKKTTGFVVRGRVWDSNGFFLRLFALDSKWQGGMGENILKLI